MHGLSFYICYFRSHCRSYHEYGGSWSNSTGLRFSPKYHLSDFVSSAHNFSLNIPKGSLGGRIVVGTGSSKFVSFCLRSPHSVNVVTAAGFVLMARVFTNIATSCQYIYFLCNVIFGRNGCCDEIKKRDHTVHSSSLLFAPEPALVLSLCSLDHPRGSHPSSFVYSLRTPFVLTIHHRHPTTQYDPFHAIAALAPRPSEEPICCLKPLTPLEPVDDDLFLSFEDWKAKRFSESSSNNQKSNGPPNTSAPTRGPAEGSAEAAAAHTSISLDTAPDPVDASPSEEGCRRQHDANTAPPPPVSASPHFRVPLTDRFNYASLDCSARAHTAHGAAKSAANILSYATGSVHAFAVRGQATIRRCGAVRGYSHRHGAVGEF